jgi:WD40 repeat protein
VNRKSPYWGLAAFEDSDLDALYFFGRERDSEIVVANLIASRLTVLYGPSGVGKSSLLLASVARTLRSLPEAPLVVVFSRWSEAAPEHVLAEAVADAARIEHGPLLDVAMRAQADRDVYLILDQAEEYFTYHGDDGFDAVLAALVDLPLRVNVLLSLREDTLAALDRLKAAIPNLFGNVLRLDRLDRAAGRAAITKPLERWSELESDLMTIEDELVEKVLDGVGTGRIELGPGGQGASVRNGRVAGIEAPYLQLVMERLWDVERSNGSAILRAATLEELGGAGQVVADHLERAIDALTPAQRDIAANLFDHLVTPSGTKIAHEASDLAQFAGASEAGVRAVVEILADHRILRRDETGRWEIFHDVLASAVLGWKTRYELARAVEAERRRRRRSVAVAACALLAFVVTATVAVWAFVERDNARDRAREARAHELEAHALRLLPTNSPLALALASEAARSSPSPAAEDVLREALLVDRLQYVLPTGGPVVDVAVGGENALATASRDSSARLYRLVPRNPTNARVPVRHVRHDAPVTAVVTESGGMLSASVDGTARFTPTGTDRKAFTLRHASPVVAVASELRCGGAAECVATGAGRTLSLWDGSTGRRVASIAMPTGIDTIVAAGPAELVVSTQDTVLRVVDLLGPRVSARLDAHARIDSIAADRAHAMVAAGLVDGSVTVWNIAARRPVGRFPTHVGSVLAVDLEDGVLLSGSADGTATVRELGTGRVVPLPGGHENIVRVVNLSADARFAVTASADGTAKVWETAGGRLISLLSGHADAILDAEFSPDARRVVTGSRDGTARVWDSGARLDLVPSSGAPPSARSRSARATSGASARALGEVVRLRTSSGRRLTLRGHRDTVNSVAFSPDGSLLVSASRDHDARVWDARTGALVHQLVGHFGSVMDARFSPDGRWIVTAGPITAGLWSVRTGELAMYLRGPSERLTAAAFGDDSETVVTREANGTTRRYACSVCGTLDELLSIAERRLRASGWEPSPDQRARYF